MRTDGAWAQESWEISVSSPCCRGMEHHRERRGASR
jgi:hypothetical protein